MPRSLRSVPPVFLVLVAITLGTAVVACAGAVGGDRCAAGAATGSLARRMPPPPLQPRVIPLRHARAGEVAATLRGVGQGRRGGRVLFFTGPVRVTAYHHGNALLVVANDRDLTTLQRLVKQLDKPRRRVRLQVSLLEGRLGPETAPTRLLGITPTLVDG